MDIFKLLPLIFRLLELMPKIQEALRTGTPILQLLQKFAPDLIDLVKSVGKDLFPNLPGDSQVEVGALKTFDQTQVRWIQDSMNKLGMASPVLVVDGDYGAKTKVAVTVFQTKHGLAADGWAGKNTSAIIQVELNKLAAPKG